MDEKCTETAEKSSSERAQIDARIPEYEIAYRAKSERDLSDEIMVNVKLPGVSNVNAAIIRCEGKNFNFYLPGNPPYHLEFVLTHEVRDERNTAFDPAKCVLQIHFPVINEFACNENGSCVVASDTFKSPCDENSYDSTFLDPSIPYNLPPFRANYAENKLAFVLLVPNAISVNRMLPKEGRFAVKFVSADKHYSFHASLGQQEISEFHTDRSPDNLVIRMKLEYPCATYRVGIDFQNYREEHLGVELADYGDKIVNTGDRIASCRLIKVDESEIIIQCGKEKEEEEDKKEVVDIFQSVIDKYAKNMEENAEMDALVKSNTASNSSAAAGSSNFAKMINFSDFAERSKKGGQKSVDESNAAFRKTNGSARKSNKSASEITASHKKFQASVDKFNGSFYKSNGSDNSILDIYDPGCGESYKLNGKTRKSILKKSFSESSGDELYYGGSATDVVMVESGDEKCERNGCKKSVRFSDVVSKKLFSSHISIVEQEKRMRKRMIRRKGGRKCSESDTETESKVVSNALWSMEPTDSTETSFSESGGDTSDDQTSSSGCSKNGGIGKNVPCSKKCHKKRGKKSARKNAHTAKQNYHQGYNSS